MTFEDARNSIVNHIRNQGYQVDFNVYGTPVFDIKKPGQTISTVKMLIAEQIPSNYHNAFIVSIEKFPGIDTKVFLASFNDDDQINFIRDII
jgi:hypothetical protein